MSSVNSVISLFSECVPFIAYSCFLILARTCSVMFKSGRRRHPWLVSHLSGKVLNFSPLSVMLTVGIYRSSLPSFKSSPLFATYYEFLLWMGIGFCQTFVYIYWYYHVILFLVWCNKLYYLLFNVKCMKSLSLKYEHVLLKLWASQNKE